MSTTDPGFWQVAAQPLATAFAGLGAIAAGTLAFLNGQRHRAQDARHFHEQSLRERESLLRERYTTAVSQLADEKPAIREGGVYALAALVDDWANLGQEILQETASVEQQVCVNVLCSYLRANARLAPESRPLDGNQHADSGFDENERAVRASILEVIRGRSRQWCEHSNLVFDLRNARLRGADLTGAHLTNAILIGANLSGVKLDNAVLRGAQLQDSNLSGACLNGADLTGANLEMAQINEKTQHMGAITTEATLPEHWLTAR